MGIMLIYFLIASLEEELNGITRETGYTSFTISITIKGLCLGKYAVDFSYGLSECILVNLWAQVRWIFVRKSNGSTISVVTLNEDFLTTPITKELFHISSKQTNQINIDSLF
jgi:hypothetical protein